MRFFLLGDLALVEYYTELVSAYANFALSSFIYVPKSAECGDSVYLIEMSFLKGEKGHLSKPDKLLITLTPQPSHTLYTVWHE